MPSHSNLFGVTPNISSSPSVSPPLPAPSRPALLLLLAPAAACHGGTSLARLLRQTTLVMAETQGNLCHFACIPELKSLLATGEEEEEILLCLVPPSTARLVPTTVFKMPEVK
ncbi:hypothetical protein PoB_006097000 [Plakobranchus ocellatus]|uniref:Uncharacterized protein n=1 Tax=Plakobranchus ocellatus TaxID=259542 RepID=A0AAV4CRK9_9GAST|nr:hypothetical protein PoB_006097000 [Plakobranchus ocellatus]